jgi:hypothetical protein
MLQGVAGKPVLGWPGKLLIPGLSNLAPRSATLPIFLDSEKGSISRFLHLITKNQYPNGSV